MNSLLNIQKGAQYIIPFDIKLNGEPVTPEDIDGLRIQIDNKLCEWPEGDLEFDSTDNTWSYPLTEEQSITMFAGERNAQVSVKIGDDILPSCVMKITVSDSIIKKRWTANG